MRQHKGKQKVCSLEEGNTSEAQALVITMLLSFGKATHNSLILLTSFLLADWDHSEQDLGAASLAHSRDILVAVGSEGLQKLNKCK